jgi:predicted ATP-dependent endonuclease of OLD family
MIESIELTNFKGFKRFQLGNLAQITLLGGPNSVGKTSILEAIFMFFDRGNPELILRQFSWRGISRMFLSTDQCFSPIFHDYDLDKNVTVTLMIDGKPESLRISFSEKLPERKIFIEKWDRKKPPGTEEKPVVHGKLNLEYLHGGHSDRSSLIITAKGLTLKDERTKPEKRPAIFISPRVPSSPAEDAQRFGELDLKNGVNKAVNFLKEFDSRIKGLSAIFYGDSSIIHADVGLSRKVPIPQLGEGLAFMLSMFLAMSAAKDGTLLVDEIATGIHHSVLPMFWSGMSRAAEQFNCQLIATTHSYEVMQAATKGLQSLHQPNFSYIRLDRGKENIVPSAYTYPVLEAALESGWEVR